MPITLGAVVSSVAKAYVKEKLKQKGAQVLDKMVKSAVKSQMTKVGPDNVMYKFFKSDKGSYGVNDLYRDFKMVDKFFKALKSRGVSQLKHNVEYLYNHRDNQFFKSKSSFKVNSLYKSILDHAKEGTFSLDSRTVDKIVDRLGINSEMSRSEKAELVKRYCNHLSNTGYLFGIDGKSEMKVFSLIDSHGGCLKPDEVSKDMAAGFKILEKEGYLRKTDEGYVKTEKAVDRTYSVRLFDSFEKAVFDYAHANKYSFNPDSLANYLVENKLGSLDEINSRLRALQQDGLICMTDKGCTVSNKYIDLALHKQQQILGGTGAKYCATDKIGSIDFSELSKDEFCTLYKLNHFDRIIFEAAQKTEGEFSRAELKANAESVIKSLYGNATGTQDVIKSFEEYASFRLDSLERNGLLNVRLGSSERYEVTDLFYNALEKQNLLGLMGARQPDPDFKLGNVHKHLLKLADSSGNSGISVNELLETFKKELPIEEAQKKAEMFGRSCEKLAVNGYMDYKDERYFLTEKGSEALKEMQPFRAGKFDLHVLSLIDQHKGCLDLDALKKELPEDKFNMIAGRMKALEYEGYLKQTDKGYVKTDRAADLVYSIRDFDSLEKAIFRQAHANSGSFNKDELLTYLKENKLLDKVKNIGALELDNGIKRFDTNTIFNHFKEVNSLTKDQLKEKISQQYKNPKEAEKWFDIALKRIDRHVKNRYMNYDPNSGLYSVSELGKTEAGKVGNISFPSHIEDAAADTLQKNEDGLSKSGSRADLVEKTIVSTVDTKADVADFVSKEFTLNESHKDILKTVVKREGLDLAGAQEEFKNTSQSAESVMKDCEVLVEHGYMFKDEDRYILTRKGVSAFYDALDEKQAPAPLDEESRTELATVEKEQDIPTVNVSEPPSAPNVETDNRDISSEVLTDQTEALKGDTAREEKAADVSEKLSEEEIRISEKAALEAIDRKLDVLFRDGLLVKKDDDSISLTDRYYTTAYKQINYFDSLIHSLADARKDSFTALDIVNDSKRHFTDLYGSSKKAEELYKSFTDYLPERLESMQKVNYLSCRENRYIMTDTFRDAVSAKEFQMDREGKPLADNDIKLSEHHNELLKLGLLKGGLDHDVIKDTLSKYEYIQDIEGKSEIMLKSCEKLARNGYLAYEDGLYLMTDKAVNHLADLEPKEVNFAEVRIYRMIDQEKGLLTLSAIREKLEDEGQRNMVLGRIRKMELEGYIKFDGEGFLKTDSGERKVAEFLKHQNEQKQQQKKQEVATNFQFGKMDKTILQRIGDKGLNFDELQKEFNKKYSSKEAERQMNMWKGRCRKLEVMGYLEKTDEGYSVTKKSMEEHVYTKGQLDFLISKPSIDSPYKDLSDEEFMAEMRALRMKGRGETSEESIVHEPPVEEFEIEPSDIQRPVVNSDIKGMDDDEFMAAVKALRDKGSDEEKEKAEAREREQRYIEEVLRDFKFSEKMDIKILGEALNSIDLEAKKRAFYEKYPDKPNEAERQFNIFAGRCRKLHITGYLDKGEDDCYYISMKGIKTFKEHREKPIEQKTEAPFIIDEKRQKHIEKVQSTFKFDKKGDVSILKSGLKDGIKVDERKASFYEKYPEDTKKAETQFKRLMTRCDKLEIMGYLEKTDIGYALTEQGFSAVGAVRSEGDKSDKAAYSGERKTGVNAYKLQKIDFEHIAGASKNNVWSKEFYAEKFADKGSDWIEKKCVTIEKRFLTLEEMNLAKPLGNGQYLIDDMVFEREKQHGKRGIEKLSNEQKEVMKELADFLNFTEKQVSKYFYPDKDLIAISDIRQLVKDEYIGEVSRDLKGDGQFDKVYYLTIKGKKAVSHMTGEEVRKIFDSKLHHRPEELRHDLLVYTAYKDVESKLSEQGCRVTGTMNDRQMRSFDMSTVGKQRVEYSDLYVEFEDIKTGEKGFINIEVDCGYKPNVIRSKDENIDNLAWYTDDKSQFVKIAQNVKNPNISYIQM